MANDEAKTVQTALGKKLKKLVADLEKTKQRIAKDRDILRDQVDEANAILEDMDMADGELNEAIRSIDRVADDLSKYL